MLYAQPASTDISRPQQQARQKWPSNAENPTFSRKVSRRVILPTPVRESCTIPMTGRLDCGVKSILGTDASSDTSARASRDWGRWRFISSPSKSALYGSVTLNMPTKHKMCKYKFALCPVSINTINKLYTTYKVIVNTHSPFTQISS